MASTAVMNPLQDRIAEDKGKEHTRRDKARQEQLRAMLDSQMQDVERQRQAEAQQRKEVSSFFYIYVSTLAGKIGCIGQRSWCLGGQQAGAQRGRRRQPTSELSWEQLGALDWILPCYPSGASRLRLGR